MPKNHSFARKPTTVLTVNEYGFLTPAEGISATINEIRAAFVRPFSESETRDRLFHDGTKYNQLVRQEIGIGLAQWVDESFVTHRENPHNMDIVSFIPSYLFRKLKVDSITTGRIIGSGKGLMPVWSKYFRKISQIMTLPHCAF